MLREHRLDALPDLPKIPCSFLIPYIMDRFGRKIILYLGALFMVSHV